MWSTTMKSVDQARELAKRVAAQAPMAVQASMMRMGMNENFDDHVHHVFAAVATVSI